MPGLDGCARRFRAPTVHSELGCFPNAGTDAIGFTNGCQIEGGYGRKRAARFMVKRNGIGHTERLVGRFIA